MSSDGALGLLISLLVEMQPLTPAKSPSGKRRVIFLREKLLCGTPPATVIAKMAGRLALWFKFFCLTSNACVRVGGQEHAINRQAAGSHGRIGDVAGVIMDARPKPILRTAYEPRLHRVHVNILHFFVIFPHRPQSAVKEARRNSNSTSARERLIRFVAPTLIDSITLEIVSG